MKDLIKNNLLSLLVVTLVGTGIAYAAVQNITMTTQTAADGDIITKDWVNAVNSKVNTVGASGSSPSCVWLVRAYYGGVSGAMGTETTGMVCIWGDGKCKVLGSNAAAGGSSAANAMIYELVDLQNNNWKDCDPAL